jgi:hypothetical protein
MDLAALYRDTQARVVDLVEPLSPDMLATPVPGTPRWTIAQVICHVTGVCADLVAGNVEGAATEPWTGRQVAARVGRRSPAQIRTYDWRGDPEPYFGLLNLFGPLPSADVAEAGAPVPVPQVLPKR